MVRATVLQLKTRSFLKTLGFSFGLSVLSLLFTVLTVMNMLSDSTETMRDRYYTDLLQLIVQTPDIEKNLRDFNDRFTHFKLEEKPIAVFDESLRVIFKTKSFRQDWIRVSEVQNAFDTRGISNHYDFFKVFIPSRHYFKGDQPFVIVLVDDKRGDFQKVFQRIFLFFFLSIVLCTFLLSIYFLRHIKRKVLELEVLLSSLEGKNKKITSTGFFDRYTRISEVINGLLTTLYSSIEQKDRIAKSKFELFSQLTHDIRTPLTSIQTATEVILQDKKLDSSQLVSLRSIINMDIDYLTKLVDDLLFLSLLEAPHEKEVDLQAITVMLETLMNKYSSSRQRLQTTIATEDLNEVILPRLEFLRLMNNLLSNAFRYSKNHVKLEVKKNADLLVIKVFNDYETLDRKAIETYGKKRNHRKIDSSHSQSSIGLGSVIIASIIEKWQGTYSLEINEVSFGINIHIPIAHY